VRPERRLAGRLARIAFIASGAVPLLALCGSPPDPMLLIYSVFVGAWAVRGRLTAIRLPLPGWLAYLGLMVLVGFLTEALAWAANYLARAEQPALLHPQLAYDLLLSPGIYGAWALGWIVVARRWRFSVAQVFVVQGLYGILLEQQGAILLQGIQAMPVGLILWLYVFLVYGSAAGLGYLPFEQRLSPPEANGSRWRFPAAFLLQFVSTAIVAIAWTVGLQALGIIIPEPEPIWQSPFW
jgi:hypothetical protein